MTFPTDFPLEKFLDMLIQQSYSNEEKAGSKADSVADKLEYIKQQILSEHEIVERLKKAHDDLDIEIKYNPKHWSLQDEKDDDKRRFAMAMTLMKLKSILENRNERI